MAGMYGADVAQLRSLAAQFSSSADRIDSDRMAVGNAIQIKAWFGPVATRFRVQWESEHSRRLASASRRLRDGADALRRNADEQERASAAGGVGSPFSASQGWGDERAFTERRGPRGARDLVRELANMKGEEDGVRIQRIRCDDGAYRYVVYVNGSGSATNGNLEWGNNPAVAQGLPTPTLLRIIQQMRASVDPPDAEVAIVGFSQGGMIAQQIADSGSFNTRSVLTFGSPVMPARNDYGGADMVRLVHGGLDPVPYMPTLNKPSPFGALVVGGKDSMYVAGLPTFTPTRMGFEPHWSHTHEDYEWVAEQYDRSEHPRYKAGQQSLSSFSGTVVADSDPVEASK